MEAMSMETSFSLLRGRMLVGGVSNGITSNIINIISIIINNIGS